MRKNEYFESPVARLKVGDEFYSREKPMVFAREVLDHDETVLFMAGKKVPCDLHDGAMWQFLLENGILVHDYDYQNTETLLRELCLSMSDVPTEVLIVVYQNGIAKGRYRNLDPFLSFCKNKNSLAFLLERGAKFKRIRGRGNSTMERYIICCQFLDVISQYPNALDKKWVKKEQGQYRWMRCEAH